MTLREHMKKYHPEKLYYQIRPRNCAEYQHILKYCQETDCDDCWNREYVPKEEAMESGKYIIQINKATDNTGQTKYTLGNTHIVIPKNVAESLEKYQPEFAEGAAYHKGTKDAWEFARFLCENETDGGMDYDDFVATYGPDAIPEEVFANMSYADAVAKYEKYMESKKTEFKVGDEVEYGVNIGVILGIINNYLTVYSRYYSDPFRTWKKENVVKTGRHYDSVAAVLEEIG